MMRRLLLIIGLVFAHLARAESFQLLGEQYQPNVPVVWSTSNVVQKSLMVYKIVPQKFSAMAVSNAMAIGSFKPITMKLTSDKNTMYWWDNRETPTRSLLITSSIGRIHYENAKAIQETAPSTNLPTYAEVERMALDLFISLGYDTNQIVSKPALRTDQEGTRMDTNGHEIWKSVNMRGVSFTRQVDGIPFCGNGGRGGFSVEFGNSNKVSSFELTWRNLQPYKVYKVSSQKDIIARINTGASIVSFWNRAPASVKQLNVVGISLRYHGEVATEPQDFAFPYAILDVVANLDGTNLATFTLDCPILDQTALHN